MLSSTFMSGKLASVMAAQAGKDENDVGSRAEGSEAGRVLLGGGAALFGIAPGAQSAGALLAEDPFVREG